MQILVDLAVKNLMINVKYATYGKFDWAADSRTSQGLEDKSSQACAAFGHRVEFALAVGKRQGESYVGIVAKDCRSFGL